MNVILKNYTIYFAFVLIQPTSCMDMDYTDFMRKIVLEDEFYQETIYRDVDDFSEPLVISLGFNCSVGNALSKFNLRTFALPFDWMRSSLIGMGSCIENDFADFLNPEYLSYRENHIFNSKYVLAFMHDFTTVRGNDGIDRIKLSWMEELEDQTSKHARRIERFYRAINSGHTVFFFRMASLGYWGDDRTPHNRQNIQNLRDILTKKFPGVNFVLVAVGFEADYRHDWCMPMVKNFYLSDEHSVDQWGNIFRQLGLI